VLSLHGWRYGQGFFPGKKRRCHKGLFEKDSACISANPGVSGQGTAGRVSYFDEAGSFCILFFAR